MANEEHLAILNQGVEVWNEWRKVNPSVKPDLSNVDLSNTNLSGADLSNTNLSEANLHRAILIGANLLASDFREAELEDAVLIEAKFRTKFSRALFISASLARTDFSGSDLRDVDFSDAYLFSANLSRCNLRGNDLSYANLSCADLSKTDLADSILIETQALGTDFSGSTLTGACIQDWNINIDTNLNDVTCDYVYLKDNQQERRPHTGTFAPGEFAKLVQQSFDTIDIIFREGLDWKAFAYSFKRVEVLHEDAHLEVRSIDNKGDGVVIVKVASAPGVDKGQIYTDLTQIYKAVSKALAAQYEARLVDKDIQLVQQGAYINQLFTLLQSSQERLGEVPKLMADIKAGDNYYGDIRAVNFTPHGTGMGGVYNDFSNTQDLTQAASQIQALLAQLQQQGQSPQDAQQQVADDLAEQAKQNPTTLGKLVMWGQKLGDATVTDVVKGVVTMALRSAGVPLP